MPIRIRSCAVALLCTLPWTPASSQGEPEATLLPLLNAGEPNIELPSLAPSLASPFVGKLEVVVEGTRHYCSATFIDTDVLLTAAHCVQKNGTTDRYTVDKFTKEGGGVFNLKANCVFVPSDWANVTDRYLLIRHDYAFLKTTTAVSGNPKDIATGNAYGTLVTLLGYPASGALTTLSAETQEDVLHPRPTVSVKTSQLGFAQGTSGGPWVRDSNGRVLSVNSSFAVGIYDKTYMRIYGPTFDQNAVTLRNYAKNC